MFLPPFCTGRLKLSPRIEVKDNSPSLTGCLSLGDRHAGVPTPAPSLVNGRWFHNNVSVPERFYARRDTVSRRDLENHLKQSSTHVQRPVWVLSKVRLMGLWQVTGLCEPPPPSPSPSIPSFPSSPRNFPRYHTIHVLVKRQNLYRE